MSDPNAPDLVHHVVAARAADRPHDIAVVAGKETLSYGRLDGLANTVAHQVAGLGAGPESLVALALTPSIELLVALLGVLKSGAAALPLDPRQPPGRLRFLVSRLKPVAIFAEAKQVPSHATAAPPACAVSEDHLAYVIYTSGSTGEPKAIAMPHRALAAVLAWQISPRGLGSWPARAVQRSPLTFDVAYQEIFGTWMTGGTLVLADEDDRHDPARLWNLIVSQRVQRTFIPLTPLRELARAYRQSVHADAVLEEVVTAGERVDLTADLRRFFAQRPGLRLVNHYGQSETIITVAHPLAGDAREWPDRVPIGKAIDGVTIHLLDADGRLVRPGDTGQIVISGRSIARGYLHQPARTAERFVPDLWADRPGARMYLTGDTGRMLPDGTVLCTGRLDDQVKIRGFRVEPGEVQACLAAHPGVAECAVVAHDAGQDGRRLIAYVVAAEHPPTTSSLRRFVAARLPDYMTPAAFVLLPALPRTPADKLDRKALPSPSRQRPVLDSPFAEPVTELEESLAELFADVLGVSPVGARDDFFELGGNSILAIRVTDLASDRLGVAVPVRALLEFRTARSLADNIKLTLPAPVKVAALIATERRRGRPGPDAERLLALCGAYPQASVAYQEALGFRWAGSLDVGALRDALSVLIDKHDVLRTRFTRSDGEFLAVVDEGPEVGLLAEDGGAGDAWALAFARRALDLAAGPPLRAALCQRDPLDHLLVVVIHHVAWDGWSAEVFETELAEVYQSLVSGRPASVPAPVPRYLDIAEWQHHRRDSARVGELTDLRARVLTGTPTVLKLPYDYLPPRTPAFTGGVLRQPFEQAAADRLARFASEQSATMPMIVLTLFGSVLSAWSGQPRLMIGTTVSDRPLRQMDGAVGFFANTCPVRFDLSARPCFRDLLGQVRDEVLAVIEAHDVPLDRLAVALPGVDRSRPRPVIQVLFADQGQARTPWRADGVEVFPEVIHNGTAKFELTLQLERGGSGYDLILEYDSELFVGETAAALLAWMNELAEAVCEHPGMPLYQLTVSPAVAGARRRAQPPA